MEKVSSDVYGCVAFDFKPSVSDELELQIGNIVKVLKEIDQFWYFGQSLHDGKSGIALLRCCASNCNSK